MLLIVTVMASWSTE